LVINIPQATQSIGYPTTIATETQAIHVVAVASPIEGPDRAPLSTELMACLPLYELITLNVNSVPSKRIANEVNGFVIMVVKIII
jgi:hypothetical protein